MSPSSAPDSVVVVGASVAGVRVVERLRGLGYAGAITLVGAETHVPYDRPPLSKQMLTAAGGPEQIALLPEPAFADLDVDLRLGVRAVAAEGTTVVLADGSRVIGDRLVVATGVTPRRLPGQPVGGRVVTLRTLDDAQALRSLLERAGRVVIVGGGLIGGEVASAARQLGVEVVLLESLAQPMVRVVGEEAARRFERLYADQGVEVRSGVTVRNVEERDDSVLVAVDDEVLAADLVLVAIGSTPASAWLTGDDDGVTCDESGRVVGHVHTYAIGDVAAWPDGRGSTRRHEHWTSAREQADQVAAHLAGVAVAPSPFPPYVWTDQFGLKVQVLGEPLRATTCVEVEAPGADGVAGTVLAYADEGRMVGAVLFGAPRRMPFYNRHVAAMTPFDELVTQTAATP